MTNTEANYASADVSSVPTLPDAVNALSMLVYAATALCTSARGSSEDTAGDGACSDASGVAVGLGLGFDVQAASASNTTSAIRPHHRRLVPMNRPPRTAQMFFIQHLQPIWIRSVCAHGPCAHLVRTMCAQAVCA